MSPLLAHLHGFPAILLQLAIGFAFGFILESSGFGDARRLAGQFYFRENRVLQVMFTAIVVASVLVFAAVGLGALDYEQVWVNPTYLWSAIAGGLLLGVGFVIGGYCPGTSLVSAATLKVDGMLFVAGVAAGIFVFGETVDLFPDFMEAGALGRYTLADLFGVSTSTMVPIVVLLALAFFVSFGRLRAAVHGTPEEGSRTLRFAGSGALVLAAAALSIAGEPGLDERWEKLAPKYSKSLEHREIYVEPAELALLLADDDVRVLVFDVRPEPAWNRFHLVDAERLDLAALPSMRRRLATLPANAVVVFMGDGEEDATRAWKHAMALAAPNAYVLDGGVVRWLEQFGAHPTDAAHVSLALGARQPGAEPDRHHAAKQVVRKVKLRTRAKKSGGCS